MSRERYVWVAINRDGLARGVFTSEQAAAEGFPDTPILRYRLVGSAALTREQVVAVLEAADDLAWDISEGLGISVTHDPNIDAIHAAASKALGKP